MKQIKIMLYFMIHNISLHQGVKSFIKFPSNLLSKVQTAQKIQNLNILGGERILR